MQLFFHLLPVQQPGMRILESDIRAEPKFNMASKNTVLSQIHGSLYFFCKNVYYNSWNVQMNRHKSEPKEFFGWGAARF